MDSVYERLPEEAQDFGIITLNQARREYSKWPDKFIYAGFAYDFCKVLHFFGGDKNNMSTRSNRLLCDQLGDEEFWITRSNHLRWTHAICRTEFDLMLQLEKQGYHRSI